VPTTADAPGTEIATDEIEAMRRHTLDLLPGLSGPCIDVTTCLYTCTPDFGFVIDTLPDCPQILVASPCSGHGFKHSAAIGEAIAQIVIDGRSND